MSLRPSAQTEVRRNRYKVAVDAEEVQRRREDSMVEIRKNKREDILQKKRWEGMQVGPLVPAVLASVVEKKKSCRTRSTTLSQRATSVLRRRTRSMPRRSKRMATSSSRGGPARVSELRVVEQDDLCDKMLEYTLQKDVGMIQLNYGQPQPL